MRKYLFIPLLLPSLLLSACKLSVFQPHGVIARDEMQLLVVATLLMLLVVIPVIVISFYFAWRYRHNNSHATYKPEWAHSTKLEIVWWSIPCIIIAVLAVITWISTHKLDPYKQINAQQEPLVIEAIALDWKWLFIYPKQDIATINYVKIPINKSIEFLITADAPMNSLEINQLAGQIYAMAGMQTKLNLMADKIGDYIGLSTNYSGDGFSDMQFITSVSSVTDFNLWVKTVKKAKNKLSIEAYKQLLKPSEKDHVKYFNSVEKHLFKDVLMKYLMPETILNS